MGQVELKDLYNGRFQTLIEYRLVGGLNTEEFIITNLFTEDEFKAVLINTIEKEIARQLEGIDYEYGMSRLDLDELNKETELILNEKNRLLKEVEILADSYDFEKLRREGGKSK